MSASVSTVAQGDELRAHATPLVVDLVEAREHGVRDRLAAAAVSASWQSDASSSAPNVRPLPFSVCAARMARGRVAGGCGATQRLELGWSVLEELVDELGEELRIVAHALAQLAEYGGVHCASAARSCSHLRSRA